LLATGPSLVDLNFLFRSGYLIPTRPVNLARAHNVDDSRPERQLSIDTFPLHMNFRFRHCTLRLIRDREAQVVRVFTMERNQQPAANDWPQR
jgi:hypothetical protein